MGCDIHSYVEVFKADKWRLAKDILPRSKFDVEVMHKKGGRSSPFDWRSYGTFGFLANVRNYSEVPCIAAPRGFPSDASKELVELYDDGYDCHSCSFLSVRELAKFDYDEKFADMRVTRQLAPNLVSGAERANPGEETITTFREFLGKAFFDDLEVLKSLGDPDHVRVVFWFDN